MYLKLGTIGVNYSTPDIDDFMIYSEVPDSSLSYESPILVRTLEELEIWFGKSMLDYPMLVEILNHGGVLYLYGPTDKEDRPAGIIDISDYQEVWLDQENEIPIPQTLLEGNTNLIPKLENYKYRVENNSGKAEWWIWQNETWIPESLFPQNMVDTSVSLNNRDTLLLSVTTKYKSGNFYWYEKNGNKNLVRDQVVYAFDSESILVQFNGGNRFHEISGQQVKISPVGKVLSQVDIEGEAVSEVYVSHPKYSEDSDNALDESFPEGDPRKDIIIESNSRGNTYSLKITYPEDENPANVSLGYGFFMYTNSSGVSKYAKFGGMTEDDIFDIYKLDVTAICSSSFSVSTVKDLVDVLTEVQTEGNNALYKYQKKPGEIILYTASSRPKFTFSGHFVSSNPGVMVEVDEDTNSRLLDQFIKSQEWPGLYFWSRTIGRDEDIYDDTRDITIGVENIEDDNILIQVSRYDYSEIFTGKFEAELGEKSVIDKINEGSKLVRCELTSDLELILPENKEYKMAGAVEGKRTGSYWKSLNTLLDPPGEKVYPDFFLIPYLFYWQDRDDSKFINLGKEYNTQFIISEKYPYQIENNLTDDKENRVMYFYGDLEINGVGFPASYPFIIGTLTNSSSYIANSIKHTLDVDINTLDEKKCNYLESNNQKYFYKRYNSGGNYLTTGWRRFIIGKISRELEKNKWEYLGNRYTGIIKNRINEILTRIKDNFSMIRNIEISEFIPDPKSETIDMTIDITTTDLVDNHVVLDILINYNKRYE